jgi:energy-coupling factor transporter ATP-binding protein EcfA2
MAGSSRVTMFGLDLHAPQSLAWLSGAETVATGRRVELSLPASEAQMIWPGDATRISDERTEDGGVLFQIERCDRGYRLAGPRHGTAIVSPQASHIYGTPGEGGMGAWQRFLIAQVLPFAAVLRGLEVFHAGAVAVDGGAVALLGPSGAGKTSIAMALCGLGAGFLADDVLSVERDGDRLLGHPGAPVAGIAGEEAERLRGRGSLDSGSVLAADPREAVVRVAPQREPLPLRAIFFLDRRAGEAAAPRFEPVVEPQVLLSATFNLVLLEGSRLEALLDVCSLAAVGMVERVVVGRETDASSLAEALAERIGIEP